MRKTIYTLFLALTTIVCNASTLPDVKVETESTTTLTEGHFYVLKNAATDEWLTVKDDTLAMSKVAPVTGKAETYASQIFCMGANGSLAFTLKNINNSGSGIIIDPGQSGSILLAPQRRAIAINVPVTLRDATGLYIILTKAGLRATSDGSSDAAKWYAYEVTYKDHDYSGNTPEEVLPCHYCHSYSPASLNESGDAYVIDDVNKLFWFAQQVNNGNGAINAELTKDLIFNAGSFAENGTWTEEGTPIVWPVIGTGEAPFKGTFNGNGNSISGLFVNDPEKSNAGLIGYCEGATIKDVTIKDSYFNGSFGVGGICGAAKNSNISGCKTVNVIANGSGNSVGGICGYNATGKIEKCTRSEGFVNGVSSVGGVCGYNESGNISKCSSTGLSLATTSAMGGICGYNVSVVSSGVIASVTDCNTDDTVAIGSNRASASGNTTVPPFDINSDGEVNISDTTCLINMVLGKSAKRPVADVNRDGKVDVNDITSVVNKILGR